MPFPQLRSIDLLSSFGENFLNQRLLSSSKISLQRFQPLDPTEGALLMQFHGCCETATGDQTKYHFKGPFFCIRFG